ncbi:dynamin [Naegleria gruberi]|uniref:Dynamin n=1 Tax=Naegleria gruberi TaxID=5762 RepID=D2V2S3_NAEGR|nr:dynamin [Naegleria gruberi]EFC48946.1 dynamin [Naegleria gruberi]|eukprot:XP_002681690.1 dynamin [Naegleria gruberi]
MEQLLPIINKIQDVFATVGLNDSIDLPQIAVVGSQSSGKSSVLENVVGRDFLPRGSGIVTRRPLILQLITIASKYKAVEEVTEQQKQQEEYGEFLHLPNKKFYNFSEIREEIVRETDRITGSNKNISSAPINLKIYSPYVLNLTLIDLPGITKVPVGDQPKDIEQQIRKMILQFISKPTCIILAVTAANTDLANSDALKLAKEVDRTGDRTLGVLTKVDIMDKGVDCMDIIRGEVLPLKMGYIGVINRSQNDINTNKSIRDALKDEDAFFRNHPSYRSYANNMGTKYLAKTLNKILLNHINNVLPELRNKIGNLLTQCQQRMKEYGSGPISDDSPGALLLQLLTDYTTEYIDSIDGRNTEIIKMNELFGGALINNIFVSKYYPQLSELEACENLTDFDIKTAIKNAKGSKTSLFVPEAAFEILVRRQVKLLEDPSIQCVDRVFEELMNIEDFCEKKLIRFPNLKERVKEFIIQLWKGYTIELKEFIRNMIRIELAYINTNHPDFMGSSKNVFSLMMPNKNRVNRVQSGDHLQQQQQQQHQMRPNMHQIRSQNPMPSEDDMYDYNPNQGNTRSGLQPPVNSMGLMGGSLGERENQEVEVIRALLTAYFDNVVRKKLADQVPKSIMAFLVIKTKSNLQSELIKELYKPELFETLLKENDAIAQKRKQTQKMLKALTKAQNAINEIKGIRL